ncbi:MAG: hemolysin III family protein [candidate division WOR-3 bacterium]|nr:hemolysin III family protein [candidate division WOR-3 bacterium]
MNKREYSVSEEVFHAVAHGIGLILAIAGLIALIILSAMRGNMWHVISTSIYGGTLVILYLNSTLYHALAKTRAEKVFRILDHSSIYLLIAGTYTPFALITIKGAWGWGVFGIVWGLAVLGIVFKAFTAGRFKTFSTILYLIMGWLIVIVIGRIINNLERGGIILLFIGGAFYSLGTVFYMLKRVPYFHLIWHIFVLCASIAHFFAVLFYVIPAQ